MFKYKFKLIDLIQLIVIIAIAIASVVLYVNNQIRNELWVKIYPIRAKVAIHQLSCSAQSPEWMTKLIQYQTINGNSPANQIAYINTKGELFHCENGYVGEYPVISDTVSENTRFRYASVTKLWTADSILGLIKDGKISFDTPIVDILTEIKDPKDARINQITIGMLLLHRGGFDRTSLFGNDMFGIGEDICPNHITRMNNITLNFNPNEKMRYSNLGYCLLGEIASRVRQKPYTQLITDNYQLDKSSIKFIGNQALSDEVSYNYVETGLTGHADIYTAFDYKGLASVAGLSGNAIDLAKQVALMTQQPEPNILSSNTALTCQLNKLRDCYGYAMFPYQQPNKSMMYFRDGALLGLSSLVAFDKNFGTIVLLSNGSKSQQYDDDIKMQLYNIANGQKL